MNNNNENVNNENVNNENVNNENVNNENVNNYKKIKNECGFICCFPCIVCALFDIFNINCCCCC